MTHTEGDGDEWVSPADASDPEPSRSKSPKHGGVDPWPDPPSVGADNQPTPRLTTQLIGLTADAARKRMRDRHPNVLLRVVDDNGGATADFISGRITLYIRNGYVVDAVAG